MRRVKIYLAGFGCLACARGTYPGYKLPDDRRRKATTLPSTCCGDIRPAEMNQKEFRELVRIRDEKLMAMGVTADYYKDRLLPENNQ